MESLNKIHIFNIKKYFLILKYRITPRLVGCDHTSVVTLASESSFSSNFGCQIKQEINKYNFFVVVDNQPRLPSNSILSNTLYSGTVCGY